MMGQAGDTIQDAGTGPAYDEAGPRAPAPDLGGDQGGVELGVISSAEVDKALLDFGSDLQLDPMMMPDLNVDDLEHCLGSRHGNGGLDGDGLWGGSELDDDLVKLLNRDTTFDNQFWHESHGGLWVVKEIVWGVVMGFNFNVFGDVMNDQRN